MVVLTGAGLLLRTLDKLHGIDPGFDTRNVLLFSIEPELAGYKGERIPQLYANLQSRLAALPGVANASYLPTHCWTVVCGQRASTFKGKAAKAQSRHRCWPWVRTSSRP